jgi:hypothetical protein
MSRRTWWVARLFRAPASHSRRPTLRPQVTTLEDRTAPAVTGAVAAGTLTVSLAAAGDQAFLRVDAGGKIELSGDNFATQVGGSPFASVDRIVVQDTTGGGGGASQSVLFTGTKPFLLANGLQSSNVESVDFEQPIDATAGAGAIDVTTPQSVLVNADLSAAGDIALRASEGATVGVNNVTVNAGASVSSAGGNVLIQAGDDLIVSGAVAAPAGNVTLESGVADADGEGTQTLNGPISASAATGRVTIHLHGQQGVNQTGGSITAHDLLLLGSGTAGTFSLTQPGNDVAVVAAQVNGALSYADASDLSVDAVGATNGITTGNDNVTLSAGGNLVVAQPVNAGTAAINLSASGSITQPAPGNAAAGGAVTLTAPGGIGSAAQPLSVVTSDLTTNTSGGDQFLQDAIGLDELNLNAGAGDINLMIAGAGSVLSGDSATDITGGTVTVTVTAGGFGANNTNAGNAIETSVSSLSVSAPLGAIFVRETNGVALANLSANGVAVLAAAGDVTVGTVSTPGNVSITTSAGSILDDGINATRITADAVTLDASGEIGQPGATADIDTAANSWTLSAGDASGLTKGVWVRDADAITVTSATTTDGTIVLTAGGTMTANTVTANNVAASRNVVLTTTAGDILLGAVSATGANPGSVRISAASGVVDNNGAAVNVTATGLALQAATGVGSADALETSVAKLAASSTAGDIQIANAGGLTVGSVGPIAGVTVTGVTGGGNAVITAAGSLAVEADVVMAGNVTLTAGESNDPPGFADDLTVNAGVTARSTGGNVTLNAGDDVNLQAGGTVKSDTGFVSISAGFGDLDGRGGATLAGTVTGNPVSVAALDDICVGTINAPGAAVSLTTSNGAILDCNDVPSGTPALNITASSLTLSAKNGIGVPSAAHGVAATDAPLEVDVTTLQLANATAGDIQVIDTAGGVSVSGSNAAPGGDIALTALGGGTLTVNASNLTSAGGNITLSADSMTLTGTVNAGAGVVTLQQAGTTARDIDLGTVTAGKLSFTDAMLDTIAAGVLRVGRTGNPGNLLISNQITQAGSGYGTLSLRAGGAIQSGVAGAAVVGTSLALQAGTGIGSSGPVTPLETQVAKFAARNSASGAIQINNTGNVIVGTVDGVAGLSNANAPIDLNGTGGAGNVTVNNPVSAGAGSITIRVPDAGGTLTNNAAISNGGGNPISLTADRMALAGGTITATGGGRVALRSLTAGELINLGSATDAAANTLELSDAELRSVTTSGVLQVGDATAGDITLTAAVAPTSVGTLSLQTAGGVTQSAGATLTTPGLAVRAANAVVLTGANDITTGALAVDVTAAGQGVAFVDANGLTVSTADGVSGVTTNNGTVTLTAGAGNLALNDNVTAGTAPVSLRAGGANRLLTNAAAVTGGSATLTADRMNLSGGTIDVGTGAANVVTLRPDSAGRFLDLGSATDAAANTLELSDAELDTITAGLLRIGRADAGAITISAPITAPAGYSTLHLTSAGAIAESGPGSLAVGNLALTGSAVSLAGNNAVAVLAGSAATGGFTFQNALDLTVGTVDGVAGVKTGTPPALNGGDVTLTLTGGKVLTLLQPVASNFGSVNLFADDMAVNATVTASGMNVASGGFVRVRPVTASRAIDVGTNTPGTLGLSVAEFGSLIGPLGVQIGDAAITGAVTVSQPITTAALIHRLDLLAANSVTVNGAVSVPAGDLAIQSHDITVNQNLTATGVIGLTNSGTLRLGTVTVDGGSGVNQAGGGPVVLTGDAQVRSMGGGASFANSIDAATAGGQSLTIYVLAGIELQQSVGETVPLASLNVGSILASKQSGPVIGLGGSVYRTTLNQSYNGAVVAASSPVLFESAGGGIGFASTLNAGGSLVSVSAPSGPVAFLDDVGSPASPLGSLAVTAKSITVNAAAVSTTGSQEYNGPVVVGSGTNFHGLGTGAIAFDSTLDGPGWVTINTGGTATLQGAVGGATPLGSLLVQAALGILVNGGLVRTAGDQTFANDTAVGANCTFQSLSGSVGFAGLLNATSPGAAQVAVLAGGSAVFLGDVGRLIPLGALAVTAKAVTVNAGQVSTTGDQAFNGPVVVGPGASFQSLGGGNIAFNSTLDGPGAASVSTSGAAVFQGAVGGATPLASLSVQPAGGATFDGGLVRTVGNQNFGSAVTLGAATTFAAGGDVFVGSTLTGAGFDVVVLSPGHTIFSGDVNVGSLTTDAPGTTEITSGPVWTVTTSAFQSYGDPVVVDGQGGGENRFVSSANGAITFAQSLAGVRTVTVNTGGVTTFNGPVSLAALTTDVGGSTQVNGGRVDTSGSQSFGDPVGLGAATTFNAGQSVAFGGSLSGAVAVVVNAPGTTRFGGVVDVGSLATDAAGQTVVGGGTVTTGGGQSFADPVAVAAGATFTAGGDVSFARDLSGGFAVTVNTPATATLGGPVNVGSLATDAGGQTIVRGGSVATGGSQQYGDDVRLGADTRLSAASGGLLFAGRLDSEDATRRQLTAAAGGDIQFGGAVGGANPLGQLLVQDAHDVTINSALRAGVVLQAAGSGTTTINGATTVTDAGGLWLTTNAIHFAADVNTASDMGLSPQGGGVTQTAGTVNVSSLELDGFGDVQLDRPDNDVRGVLRANRGGGTVRVADRNDLTIDNVRGFVTRNGDVFLSAGNNFTADSAGSAAPMIQLGSGQFVVRPGLNGGASVLFNMEATAALVSLGVADGGNNGDDQFTVRPSATTPIAVFGNLPGTPLRPGQQGDRLFPFLAGLSVTQFQFNGQDGFYAFTNRAKLSFSGIDSLQKLALSGFVVQTGEPQDATGARQVQYAVRIVRSQDGVPLPGGIDGAALLQNPFVVSPALVNPASPNSAPRIAFGDVNGDGAPDLILAGGAGTAPLITVVDGRAINAQNGQLPRLDQLPQGQILAQFYAYEQTFLGGVNVAVGDFDGDGLADIVTGADITGGARVRIFSGKSLMSGSGPQTIGGSLGNFFAYEPSYRGGVRVGVGDVNGDGRPDLVLGAGTDGGPRVRVLDGKTGGTIANFFAYDPAFRGGIYVDAGDYDGDGFADILTGAGAGGPHVRVFSGQSAITGTGDPTGLASFFAFPPSEQSDPLFGTSISMSGVGGVAFTSGSQGGSRNILVGTARGPQVRVTEFEGNGHTPTNSVDLLDEDQFRVQGVNPTTQVKNPVILPLPTLIGYGATVAGFADLSGTTPGAE